jgi:hypothetical protein
MEIRTIRNVAPNGDTKVLPKRRGRRERYKRDSVFRRKWIDDVLKRHKERSTNTVYKKLVQVRKDIWWQRERISRWTLKLEGAERKLLALLEEKRSLEDK